MRLFASSDRERQRLTDVERQGRLDLLRLRFSDPALEEKFRKEHVQRSLPVIRIALLLGIALVAGFSLLDVWMVEVGRNQVYIIRFAVVIPVLLGLFLLTFTPGFDAYMQWAVAAAMLAVGGGVIAMTAVIDQPGSYLYYAGVLDTIIYCCCVMRLRFYNAILVSSCLLAAYQVAAIFINPVPEWALANNNFFLFTAIGVGTFAAYVQEFYLRVAHRNEALLIQERDRSQDLLAKAEAASQAKSDFLAMVSHELRTPLNAIIGFSEMMTHQIFGDLGDRRYLAYADDIHSSGNHLLEVINNILDLSKAEAGRLELNEETVNLRTIVDTVTRLMSDNAAQRDITLTWNSPEKLPMLRADRSMVTRIVMNLLSNAVKFTEPGGHIDVSASQGGDGEIVLTVSDDGVGIAADDLDQVMQPFIQADSSLSRKHEGTGLGLPLTKKMVELHGGRLELESAPGVGTTARVTFPGGRLTTAYLVAAE